MACRKNADRGLMELADHLEKQREETARQQRRFEEEQRKIWTPPSLLETCCLQWLAHGPHQIVLDGPSSSASTKSRGCSGGCAKGHPKISLTFEDGVATASTSHAFDSLLQYFDDLPAATQTKPLQYRLTGLLSNHYEGLKQKFGAHLVSVDPTALSASQRAHEKMLQQEYEQAQKKRRVSGPSASTGLLEGALEICYIHSLGELLDVADIAWMRTSCKALAKVASWMARDRMKTIELSYIPSFPYWPPNGDRTGDFDRATGPPRPLDHRSTADTFFPSDPQALVTWDVRGRRRVATNPIFVQIYLVLGKSSVAEKGVLFGKGDPPLLVAEYKIDLENRDEAQGVFRARSNVQSREDEGTLEYRLSHGMFDSYPDAGEMAIRAVRFSFNDLLGIYVRRRLSQAKKAFNASDVKRPSDKAYIKALAALAREAPGNADSFRRMYGWRDVYN